MRSAHDEADRRPVIELSGVSRVFQMGDSTIRAVDDVSLQIDSGEFVAVMGPSGSGKSTLMNLIGCLDTPSGGRLTLARREVSGLDDDELSEVRNREIGFVFQTFNLLPRATAIENVALPLVYSEVPAQQREQRARSMLEEVGLADRMLHRPSELSGGQRQRVAIARALVNEPSLLLADEPTGNLDSSTTTEIMQLICGLHDRGHTVVMVTHDHEIARHADRVVQMHDGRIRSDDAMHGT